MSATATPDLVIKTINECRDEVKRLRENQVPKAEIDEKIAKVAAGLDDLQKKIKEDVKRPSQGDAIVGARMLGELGAARVKDIRDVELQRKGLRGEVTPLRAVSEDVAAAVEQMDRMFIVDAMLSRKFGGRAQFAALKQMNGGERTWYLERAKSVGGAFGRLIERHDRLTRDLAEIQKTALSSTGSTAGDEWVPTGFASNLLEQVRVATPTVNLFPVLSMPTNPFTNPVMSTVGTAYIRTENTAVTEATLATTNRTWTAYTFANYQAFSDEITEDSVIAVAPAVQADIVRALAEGLEMAIVNGDADGAGHFDEDYDNATAGAGNTFNTSFSGLRQMTLDAATITTDGGGLFLSAATVALALGSMGKFAAHKTSELALLVNNESLLKLITEIGSPVSTVDKYGASATILTGELGRIYGVPIFTSHGIEQRRNAVGTGGKNTGGTAGSGTDIYSTALVVNRMNFRLGDRRDVRFESDKDITAGKNQMVATARWGFNAVEAPSTSLVAATSIVNID